MFRKLAGLTAIAGLFLAGTASAQITGTDHDLRTRLTINEICVVCHAPHNNLSAPGELLWNHSPTTQAFTAYSSPTLNGASSGPGETSLLCLGCHDGVVAVDSYGGSTGTDLITGAAAFGADLSDDHPVGITYDPVADTELQATTNPVTFGSGAGTVADMLQANAVECASCHDVHNTLSAGNAQLLNVSNVDSELCFACHNK
jgi:predicted CXXCH cytochrome family protein